MAAAPAGGEVDGRAPGRGIRSGLHAGTVRAASGRGARRCARSGAPHRLRPPLQVPSEDCLYLNVWRPADPAARNLPVMVWIYGGGFTGGSSSSPNTSGAQFAKQGVVLVAMNYRVGRFGFFAFPGVEQRASRRDQGQLRLHGPDRRPAVGEAEHRRLRRQSEQRHHLRVLRGWRLRAQHAGVAAGARPVPQSHRRVRRLAGQRAHRPADACGRRRSELSGVGRDDRDHTSRNRWGSKARTRPLWPVARASAPTQVLRGAPAQPGANAPSYETTPILDGKLITETAETAYKARRQPRVPLLARQQQRRYRRQPDHGSHQGRVVRPVRPVERRGEGGLRS